MTPASLQPSPRHPVPVAPPPSEPAFTPPAFTPSLAQRRLLNFIDEHPGFLTVTEICARSGIPRRTYYRWCEDPAFRAWLAVAWSGRLIVDGAILLNIARARCSRNFSYWKALFNLTFDPKGLVMLQQWQQACAQVSSSAYHPEPDPAPGFDLENDVDPEPGSAPDTLPAPRKYTAAETAPPQQNQPLARKNGTKPAASPVARAVAPSAARPTLPHHLARVWSRAVKVNATAATSMGKKES